jgi:AAA domain (dynein-related subfamily)
MPLSREDIAERLAEAGYIADDELANAIAIMQLLKRPLLLEGEAGVGKTEVAKALASACTTRLIRLQCYEGLDQSAALYEWNYQRQLLAIQAHQGKDASQIEDYIFSEKYLLERPLLAAIRQDNPPVLLIDEVDRADEEFEAFLLEILSDFQVSIPELGTVQAVSIPHVVLTSNGTRTVGRTASALPLPLCRLSRRRARDTHHYDAHCRRKRDAVAANRADGRENPQGRPTQGAWRGRNTRLGGRPGRARCFRPARPTGAGARDLDVPPENP